MVPFRQAHHHQPVNTDHHPARRHSTIFHTTTPHCPTNSLRHPAMPLPAPIHRNASTTDHPAPHSLVALSRRDHHPAIRVAHPWEWHRQRISICHLGRTCHHPANTCLLDRICHHPASSKCNLDRTGDLRKEDSNKATRRSLATRRNRAIPANPDRTDRPVTVVVLRHTANRASSIRRRPTDLSRHENWIPSTCPTRFK